LFESKRVWNQNLFEKRLFYEEVEKQSVVFSFQSVVYHLEVFEKGLKLVDLVEFAVKPIQTVVSRIQPIVC